MIKTAVGQKGQKSCGVVAIIALGVGRRMEHRLADRDTAIVALAAVAEYFLVIHRRDDGESPQRCRMTGRALVTGGDMICRLPWNTAERAVVAGHAVRGQAFMESL